MEGVFGGDAVTGQGVKPGDVDGDGGGCESFVVEAIDLAGFPNRGGDGMDARFFGWGRGAVLGAKGFEEGFEFRDRGRGRGSETVLAGVVAGRSFAASGTRAGTVASVGAVGGDACGAGHRC